MVNIGKPICALCVTPTVVAKAFEDSDIHPQLTLGTTEEDSEYDIQGFSDGIAAVGAKPEMKTVNEILIDKVNKIVSAPCYMMKTDVVGIRNNVKQALEATIQLVE